MHRRVTEILRHSLLMPTVIKTIVLFMASINIGYIISLLGVTLLDLQAAIGATLDETALLYTYMNLGRIAGAVVVTRLLDQPPSRLTMEQSLALSMGVMALSTAAVPWCRVYGLMAIAVAAQGAACGHSAVACNVGCFRLWGARTAPVLQGMALAFSVGLSMAPVAAAPFICISSNQFADSDNRTMDNSTASTQPERSHSRLTINRNLILDNAPGPNRSLTYPSISPNHATAMSQFSSPFRENQFIQTSAPDDPFFNYTSPAPPRDSCAFHWPYTIIAILALTLTIVLLYLSARDGCSGNAPVALRTPTPDAVLPSVRQPIVKQPTAASALRRTAPIYLLFGFHYLCLANIETTFGGLILSFCVHQMAMTKTSANVVTLVYWVANMASRIPVILVSRRFSPTAFLGTNTTVICVSVLTLAIAGTLTSHQAVLWVCSAGLGVGCATAFTHGLTLANQCTPISPRFVSLVIACHSVGCMTGPAVAGLLFRRWGPAWFLYYLTWWALLMLVNFVAIQVYRRTILRNNPLDDVFRALQEQEIPCRQLHEALIQKKDLDIVADTEKVV